MPRLLPLLFLLGFAACSRQKAEDSAQARTDLEHVCRAQRSFVETRKLMKSVSEKDLAREREARFSADVKGSLIKAALAEASRAPAGARRKPLDVAAAKAGLKDWRCPELDQL